MKWEKLFTSEANARFYWIVKNGFFSKKWDKIA